MNPHSGHDRPMYEEFAAEFAAHAEVSAYNAYYDRPALLALAGDVDGLDVLDAGCGPGLYAEALVAAGARVTGVDVSPAMVELARARVGAAADLRVADLQAPPLWLRDDSQDLVVMALVLHHLDDRVTALRELRRVLRPTGALVLSSTHPMDDWRRYGGRYFDVEQISETWNLGWQLSLWRQPLSRWCDEFAEAGFLIERLVEPRPDPEMAERFPDTYDELSTRPGFVAFRLVPDPRRS